MPCNINKMQLVLFVVVLILPAFQSGGFLSAAGTSDCAVLIIEGGNIECKLRKFDERINIRVTFVNPETVTYECVCLKRQVYKAVESLGSAWLRSCCYTDIDARDYLDDYNPRTCQLQCKGGTLPLPNGVCIGNKVPCTVPVENILNKWKEELENTKRKLINEWCRSSQGK